jgi:hypothetical protein
VALNAGPLATIRHSPLSTNLTDSRLFFNAQQAVETYENQYVNKE